MVNVLWITMPALTAAALSFALTPVVARLANLVGAVDMPGARKIHTLPVPRLGGLAVVTSIAAVLGLTPFLTSGKWQLPPNLIAALSFGVMPIGLVSLIDDIRSVGARKKLLAHTAGATIAVFLGVSLGPVVHLLGTPLTIGVLATPLSILWIVGVTNAFNIIDGLDGLSAGLALISAMSMAAVFMLVGEPRMGAVVLVLAGALAGFLPYNVHPAKMFLGDCGATAIGFCLAVFALKGGTTLSTGFAALLPVFILGLPIADTLITMARRLVGRLENPDGGVFVADSNHIHHRLLALGIDHGQAVVILYAAGLVLAFAAFVSVFMNAREAGMFVMALLLAGFVGLHRLGYDEFAFIRRGTVLKLYEMPAVKGGMFVVFVDIFMTMVAAYVAIGLKTDQWSFTAGRAAVLDLSAAYAPVTVVVFWWSGMYRGSWRVAGLLELARACVTVVIACVSGAVVLSLVSSAHYPLSVFAIYGIISLVVTTGMRASYVVLETTRRRTSHQGVPVLIYGAGNTGVAAARELFRDSKAGLRPVGFIDDDVRKRGRLVGGLPVLGTQRDLDSLILGVHARALLIASAKISEERIARASNVCGPAGVKLLRLNFQVECLAESSVSRAQVLPTPALMATPPPVPVGAVLSVDIERPAGAETCPSCKGHEVLRSKARTLYEQLMKAHTPKRLFRCHHCGWRGWLVPLDVAHGTAATRMEALDLSRLDRALFEVPVSGVSGDH
jgi:UDP-GlcNAc:undecaprenyl-phosphate GlcNAc-1-phosphate transferase